MSATPSEILDLMDRLQRDPSRRLTLESSWELYQAAVAEGLIEESEIDGLAARLQELTAEELIAYRAQSAGVYPPPGGIWDGAWIQQLHGWRVTAKGRADAAAYRSDIRSVATAETPRGSEGTAVVAGEDMDVFLSHAGEDKEAVARPLAEKLRERGWSVWLDELELTIGDSLERQINSALARSRFGVVILSPAFFAKEWPQRELQGLAAREVASGTKVILPVWHDLDHATLVELAPMLADKLGAPTSRGLDFVADEISRALAVALGRRSGTEKREAILQAVPVVQPAEPEAGDASADAAAESIDTGALLALGLVVQEKGDLFAAKAYYRRAIDAGDGRALTPLAMLLRDVGRLEEAERCLRQAVEEGHGEALTPLGLVLRDRGELSQAEVFLRRAVTAQPQDSPDLPAHAPTTDKRQRLRNRDANLLRDLRSVLPREAVRFAREHDFGGSWMPEASRPFNRYAAHRDEVEYQFSDPDLERLRRDLVDAVRAFTLATATGASLNVHRWLAIPGSAEADWLPDESDEYKRWDKHRSAINDAGSRVAACYDALLTSARDKGLLEAPVD